MPPPPPPPPAYFPRDKQFQRMVRLAVQSFITEERKFYLSLSKEDSKTFDPRGRGGLWLACHNRHHLHLLTTLHSLKPCFFISHAHHVTSTYSIYRDLIWIALMNTYRLADYGFLLVQVSHDTVHDTGEDNPHGPGTVKWTIIRKGSCLFVDTLHEDWPMIRQVFLSDEHLIVSRFDKKYYMDRISGYLGCPVPWPRTDEPSKVCYVDQTETDAVAKAIGILPGQAGDELCVIAVWYLADDGTDETKAEFIKHFNGYKEVMEGAGHVLTLDSSRHRALDEFYWGIDTGLE